MDAHHFGPQYCETSSLASSFPLELINTLTSLVPVLLGAFALWWLYRSGERFMVLYILAALLLLTGIGSTLWHGLRTPLMLSFDVYPGLLFFILFAFTWPWMLGNRWWGYATVVGLWVLVFLFDVVIQVPGLHGYISRFVVPVVLVSSVLIGLTYLRARPAWLWSVATLISAFAAVFFRTIDGYACAYSPVGSHFLWHIFLGTAGFCGIILLVRIRAYRNEHLER